MDSVEIQLTPESEVQKLDFITWKNDWRSFYAKPSNGKHRVISLIAALPENSKWKGNPFPECVQTKITPCTLLPPRILEWWEYDQIPMEEDILFLTAEDSEPLSAHLDMVKRKFGRPLATKRKEIVDAKTSKKRREKIQHLREAKRIAKPHLRTALGMVKEGDLGIRNDYLIECWAKRRKLDLDEMSQQRIELLDWQEKHHLLAAPPDQNDSIRGDIEIQKHLARRKPFPAHRHFDQPMKNKWPDGFRDEIWWVLAKVTHKIEFEDEKTFYLFGVDIREDLRPSEIAELSSIRNGPLNPEAEKKLALADRYLGERVTVPGLISSLTPDENRLYNLLVEPHPYKLGQPLSLREIGEHLGISHSTVRERQKKLMNAHEWTKHLILSARQGNSKKPHPNVLKPPTSKSMSPPFKQ
jgi:hypothetical protein